MNTQNTLTQTSNEVLLTPNLLNNYIAYIDATPKTVETYSKALKQFYSYTERNQIKQPTRQDIINFREYLEQNHKASTVNTYIIAIRQFFKWTELNGIYANIADHVKGKKISREPKKDYLTPNQIKNILSSIDRTSINGKRDYALIALMVTCGLRDIEVNRANVEDIRVQGVNTVLFLQGKGRDEKNEYVIIPGNVEIALREYLKERNATETEPLFTSISNHANNERLTTRSISRTVKNAFIKCGYDSNRLTAHSLRHTAVTLALQSGNSLQEVQQFARHTNINTTMIYAHNLEKQSNKCSNSIAKELF